MERSITSCGAMSTIGRATTRGGRCEEVPAHTDVSDRMSRDLKKLGFNFVGSTICYSFMQAVGMVNDHTVDCFRHAELSIEG